MKHYINAFIKYIDFKGRASRKEFWSFSFFHLIVFIVSLIIDVKYNSPLGGMIGLYALVSAIPSIAITARRLNDANKSPWMILVAILLPGVGLIWLIALLLIDSELTQEEQHIDISENLKKLTSTSSEDSDIDYTIFNRNSLAIEREDHLFQANRNYKVYDTNTKEVVLHCIEREKSGLDNFLRYTSMNKSTSGIIDVCNIKNEILFSILKSSGRILSTMTVIDNDENVLAKFDTSAKTLKQFVAFSEKEEELFYVENKLTSISKYAFISSDGNSLGIAREKLVENFEGKSSASSTFFLEMNKSIPQNSVLRPILVAATMYCDMI